MKLKARQGSSEMGNEFIIDQLPGNHTTPNKVPAKFDPVLALWKLNDEIQNLKSNSETAILKLEKKLTALQKSSAHPLYQFVQANLLKLQIKKSDDASEITEWKAQLKACYENIVLENKDIVSKLGETAYSIPYFYGGIALAGIYQKEGAIEKSNALLENLKSQLDEGSTKLVSVYDKGKTNAAEKNKARELIRNIFVQNQLKQFDLLVQEQNNPSEIDAQFEKIKSKLHEVPSPVLKASFLINAFFYYLKVDSKSQLKWLYDEMTALWHDPADPFKKIVTNPEKNKNYFAKPISEAGMLYFFYSAAKQLKLPVVQIKKVQGEAQLKLEKSKAATEKLFLMYLYADQNHTSGAVKIAGELLALHSPEINQSELAQFYLEQQKWGMIKQQIPGRTPDLLQTRQKMRADYQLDKVVTANLSEGELYFYLALDKQNALTAEQRSQLFKSAEKMLIKSLQLSADKTDLQKSLELLIQYYCWQTPPQTASVAYLFEKYLGQSEWRSEIKGEATRELTESLNKKSDKLEMTSEKINELTLIFTAALLSQSADGFKGQAIFKQTQKFLDMIEMMSPADHLKKEIAVQRWELLAKLKEQSLPEGEVNQKIDELMSQVESSSHKARLELTKINYFIYHRQFAVASNQYDRLFKLLTDKKPESQTVIKQINEYYPFAQIFLNAADLKLGQFFEPLHQKKQAYVLSALSKVEEYLSKSEKWEKRAGIDFNRQNQRLQLKWQAVFLKEMLTGKDHQSAALWSELESQSASMTPLKIKKLEILLAFEKYADLQALAEDLKKNKDLSPAYQDELSLLLVKSYRIQSQKLDSKKGK